MKRLYLIVCLMLVLSPMLKGQPKYYMDTLLFAFNKADITKYHHPAIDSMLRVLLDHPSHFIRIVGHTDTVGTDPYNLALSKRRSVAVVKSLVKKGVDSVRIEYQWRGFHQPVASNITDEGRRLNRRVNVFVIYDKPKVTPPPPPPPAPPKVVDTIPPPPPKPKVDPVPPKIDPPKPKPIPVDTFFTENGPAKIDCNHQTVLFGPNGTKVTIPPKAFQECNDNIKFELKEYLTTEDMILKKMHTMTKKDMLEVQGIVCLKALKDGRPQMVQANTSLIMEMPAPKHDREARIFATPGTGNYSWRQVTVGNDIPPYDPDYKRYTMGMYELGCIAVGKKCDNKDKKGYVVELKLKKLKDKNPQIFYVSKDATAISMAKKSGSAYVIENICNPGPATVIATQVVDGVPYIASKDLTAKQIDALKKKRLTKVKMKFVRTTEEDLPQKVKDAL